MERGQIVAGNPKIFSQILHVLQPHLSSKMKS
jgi:hypothetical protein